jgi:hypothetical protein
MIEERIHEWQTTTICSMNNNAVVPFQVGLEIKMKHRRTDVSKIQWLDTTIHVWDSQELTKFITDFHELKWMTSNTKLVIQFLYYSSSSRWFRLSQSSSNSSLLLPLKSGFIFGTIMVAHLD